MKPDSSAQFRSTSSFDGSVYMGGTAMSCGQHPSLPKRHRWSAWREIKFHSGAVAWERTCKTCALVSDYQWTKPSTLRSDRIKGVG
jgi:hypothetical protein